MSVAPDSPSADADPHEARPGHPRSGWLAWASRSAGRPGRRLGLVDRTGATPRTSEAAAAGGDRRRATPAPPSAVRVDVVKPRPGGLVRQTIQPGSVHAFESVDIYAKVSGFLKTQEVDIGDVGEARRRAGRDRRRPSWRRTSRRRPRPSSRRRRGPRWPRRGSRPREAEREAVAATRGRRPRPTSPSRSPSARSARSSSSGSRACTPATPSRRGWSTSTSTTSKSAQAGERSARAAALTAKAQLAASEAKVLQAKADVAEAQDRDPPGRGPDWSGPASSTTTAGSSPPSTA